MATASLPSSCEEQQNNNLDEYSDDRDAESEKVRKAKKAKKPDNEKWSSSLICNLIDEYEARPCLKSESPKLLCCILIIQLHTHTFKYD